MFPQPLANSVYVTAADLRRFMEQIFESLGVPSDEARLSADVLLEADLRGIDSHGIGRLSIYVGRLRAGTQAPASNVVVVEEGPGTAVVDGGGGMGHVVSAKAMEIAIRKAKENGIAGIAVRNSSHFGFAGYYPLMAVEHGMVGMAFTNARPSICPTFGTEPMLGTNPIAFGAPTDLEFPCIFDAATSIIQRGTVELYERIERPVPSGLVVGPAGEVLTDPTAILAGMLKDRAALLPLGGRGEETGGHKGYGLAIMVEILSAALQNGPYLKQVTGIGMGHFLLALDITRFLPLDVFRSVAGGILRELQNSRKEPGQDRIYVPGEKEHFMRKQRMESGIPLPPTFLVALDTMADEQGVARLGRK
jgi:LDH2 family malate/lactate/ureidoglycolate dehydrogenase